VKKTGDQRIPLAAPDRQPVVVGVWRRRQGIGAQGRLRLTRDRHADRQKLPGNLPVERFAVDAAQIEEADDLAFGLDLEDFELDIGVAHALRDGGRVRQQRDRAKTLERWPLRRRASVPPAHRSRH
jgi:hypothetical protein